MALRPNSLPIGATLTFSLTGRIPLQGVSATSSLVITVNAPPSPGRFYVTPTSGVALQQVFQFVAQQWVDPDLPLQYQFGYLDTNNLEITLRSRVKLSFGSSMLTAGIVKDQFAVTCITQIFDALNANTSTTAVITVTHNVAFNASETQAFIQRSLSSAAADGIRQAVLQSSYLLNTVDCALAPNCSAIHRQSCSSTAHTCGGSVSSSSSGEAIDSDIDNNNNVNEDTAHSDSISTMSTAEAAAALEVYRVIEKPNNKQPATAREARAFVSKIVTSGVRKVSTVVPHIADQARDSVVEGSSDDYKSSSDLSS